MSIAVQHILFNQHEIWLNQLSICSVHTSYSIELECNSMNYKKLKFKYVFYKLCIIIFSRNRNQLNNTSRYFRQQTLFRTQSHSSFRRD